MRFRASCFLFHLVPAAAKKIKGLAYLLPFPSIFCPAPIYQKSVTTKTGFFFLPLFIPTENLMSTLAAYPSVLLPPPQPPLNSEVPTPNPPLAHTLTFEGHVYGSAVSAPKQPVVYSRQGSVFTEEQEPVLCQPAGIGLSLGNSDSSLIDPRHRTVVCHHWLDGRCMNGEHCMYLHQFDLSKMPECKNGAACKWFKLTPAQRRKRGIKYCPKKVSEVNAK